MDENTGIARRLVGIVDDIAPDRDSTSVRWFVKEARRRGYDPYGLLDADFLLRGLD